jgi:uncharacterized protein (TIGR03086 family)
MDNVALLRRTVDQIDRLSTSITDEQLTAQTPCTEWKVRDLLNHITGGATMFAISAEQGSVPDDEIGRLMGGDNLGDDWRGAWQVASRRAIAVYDQPGIMDKMVKLPFGEMPAGIALGIAIFDVTTHAADLATATGQKVDDEELLDAALAMGKQMIGPDLRVPGVFGPEQPCGQGATSAQKLLAFAGRTV